MLSSFIVREPNEGIQPQSNSRRQQHMFFSRFKPPPRLSSADLCCQQSLTKKTVAGNIHLWSTGTHHSGNNRAVCCTQMHHDSVVRNAASDKNTLVRDPFVQVSMLIGACLPCRPWSHSAEGCEKGEGGCHEHHHAGRHEGDCSQQAGLD